MLHRPTVVIVLAAALTLTGCAGSPAPAAAPASVAVPAAAATPTPTPTPAASSSPVVAEDLALGTQDGGVDVEIAGPTQVAIRRITIEPGAGTGLHCHYGQLLAVVEQGTFTHRAPIYPSGVHVYEAGESLGEGASYVHEGMNEGTEDVVLLVTYVIPEGKPLAEADLTKCGF